MCIIGISVAGSVNASDLNETVNIMESTENEPIALNEDSTILSTNHTPKNYNEIKSSLDVASDNDTIILDGYYLFEDKITVNKTLTFQGINDATVDGNSKVRLFTVTSQYVVFKNITFKNAYSNEGGAISGGCTVINCTFINNTAYGSGYYTSGSGYGGAILGECEVIESTFINNSARNGGALYGVSRVLDCTFINNSAREFGGAMYSGSAVNCTFKNNFALAGGALYETDVFNSSFIGNIAHFTYGYTQGLIDTRKIYSGGAMYGGNANNCTFINNSADYGGAIFLGNANNCSFIRNNATYGGANYKCKSLNSIFTNNLADKGGAVYAGSFNYCRFNNNRALSAGNEIYIDSSEIYSSTCSLENCNFTNCVSNENWMISYNGISKLMIDNFKFINCSSSTNGGAVNLKYGKVYFTNCYFEGNTAIKGGAIYYNEYVMALENCYFKNNSAEYGGAIYSEFMNSIDGCSFESNNAIYGGNEIFFNGTGNLILNNCNFTKCISNVNEWFIDFTNIDSLTINSCNFINCSSKGNGGAILIKDNLKYNILNSYFEGNKATNGGVIYSKMKDFSCDNCTFVDNNADYGGVIYIDRVSSTVMTNCTFINNHATSGGAFYSSYGNFQFDNCNFTDNEARFGGAMNINNVKCSNLTNCIFERNMGNGGGIYFENSISLIDNCKFINQYAFNYYVTSYGYGTVEGDGGALYVVDSEIKVYNSEFKSNEAMLDTGAILGYVEAFNCLFESNFGGHSPFSSGAMKEGIAINCTFENNHGSKGAAIYEGSAINCTFIHNHLSDGSQGPGGAIYNTDAFNCTFINNNAVFGGAMYGGSASNCTFIGNTAYKNGGAIYASSVENSTFINNSASNGGAVYSNSNINDCTFINCSASNNGGAIAFNTLDSVSLTNSRFIDCHANNQSGAVDFGQCGNLTISKCSFENCTAGNDSSYFVINDTADVYLEDCIFDELPEDMPVHYTSYLTVNNLKITLGDTAVLLANLSNVQGPLFNKTIIFTIGSEKYNRTTDNNGQAIFDLGEYLTSPRKYTIGVNFLGDGVNSNVTVDSNVSVNSYQGILTVNVEGKYYDDVVLKFKLVNSKTNDNIFNATVKVKFDNGEIVYLKTNNEGIVTYHVPFAPGTYNATAVVIDENSDVKNVTISNIVINKIEGLMKITQVDNNILNVRVYNPADGHQYRNITVTLKFNHIDSVNVVTNDEGVAVYNMEFDYGAYSVFASINKPYTNIDAVSVDDIVIKEDNSYATVSFSSGIVFDYGTSGSIYVTVKGGSVEVENIKVLNHPEARITLVKNVITVSNLNPGIYTLMVVSTPFGDLKAGNGTVNINVKKATAVIKAEKITVALKKGAKWTITLINSKTKNPIGNMKLTLMVYTGKKYKKVYVTTNSNGVASYQTKGLSKGAHKVVVSGSDSRYDFNTLTSSIKVIKQKALKFKVKKNIAKDGSSLSITVKKGKKPINGIKIKLLVFTGKKYKTITLKTKTNGKYKGVCGWGTNKLTVGTHKIVIMPVSIKYSGSKTVKMTLKKSAKKYPNWETKI